MSDDEWNRLNTAYEVTLRLGGQPARLLKQLREGLTVNRYLSLPDKDPRKPIPSTKYFNSAFDGMIGFLCRVGASHPPFFQTGDYIVGKTDGWFPRIQLLRDHKDTSPIVIERGDSYRVRPIRKVWGI